MTRFAEHPATFTPRRSGSADLTGQEQATVFAAREIIDRHLNRNIADKARKMGIPVYRLTTGSA